MAMIETAKPKLPLVVPRAEIPALEVGQLWSPRRQWRSGPIPSRTILAIEGDRVEWENVIFRTSWPVKEFRAWIRKTDARQVAAEETNNG